MMKFYNLNISGNIEANDNKNLYSKIGKYFLALANGKDPKEFQNIFEKGMLIETKEIKNKEPY